MTDISPELVARMADAIRASASSDQSFIQSGMSIFAEHLAIAKLLPPEMGQDKMAALKVLREVYPDTHLENGKLRSGEGPARVVDILNGHHDYWEFRFALAALKRGRELASQS